MLKIYHPGDLKSVYCTILLLVHSIIRLVLNVTLTCRQIMSLCKYWGRNSPPFTTPLLTHTDNGPVVWFLKHNASYSTSYNECKNVIVMT